MPYIHEFGIIANIDEVKDDIGYAPETYGCITIHGDFIDDLRTNDFGEKTDFGEKIDKLQTFAHSTDRPYNNLCYYGITLIPPSSHTYFLKIVNEANDEYKSEELEQLIKKIEEAIKGDKWMIHFGV